MMKRGTSTTLAALALPESMVVNTERNRIGDGIHCIQINNEAQESCGWQALWLLQQLRATCCELPTRFNSHKSNGSSSYSQLLWPLYEPVCYSCRLFMIVATRCTAYRAAAPCTDWTSLITNTSQPTGRIPAFSSPWR